ncbi:MAG: EAL domain-containing protein [Desulfocapsa sp.]|nr:EAL domain-containing protein [Desulfocapsa sp.]
MPKPFFFIEPEQKKELLKTIDVLSFFHESTLERIAQESKEFSLEPDVIVFEEGEPGSAMYIVLEGEILIYQDANALTTMLPGTFFGEMSLIESVPRTAGAKTLIASVLLEINETQFQEYFATQPQALMAIMKTLSARSRKISNELALSSDAKPGFKGYSSKRESAFSLDEHYREILVFDPKSYQFIKANSLACMDTGFTPEEIQQITFVDLAPDLDPEKLKGMCDSLIHKIRPIFSFETALKRKDGSTYPAECKIQLVKSVGPSPEVLLWIHDVTERKQMEGTIRQMAYYDSLTGLPNRNLLNDRLAVAVTNAARNNQKVAILFLDLDHFKTINDSLGHESGDQLLQQVSLRIKGILRKQDTIARMGGDEFIVLIPGLTDVTHTIKLADKILASMATVFNVGDNELYIGCSIGISIFPDDGMEIRTLLKNSDLAMYRAKEKGRNTFELYTPSMNLKVMVRLAMEKNMRKALDREEFELYYQPKINLKSRKIAGMEALLRWNSLELGIVTPSQFIPVAEETRLIIQLGHWVLVTACQQAKLWREAGLPEVPISVNLSVIQFTHPNLVSEIIKVLEEMEVPPHQLELEITESILMQDTTLAVSILNKLSEVGIKISLDDFGTGFSSLNYLKNLPLDYLKIDQTFVQDYDLQTNAAITNAIVTLAQSLNMKTIAEGVETDGQKKYLQDLNCDEAQGNLFSEPVPASRMTELLKAGKKF